MFLSQDQTGRVKIPTGGRVRAAAKPASLQFCSSANDCAKPMRYSWLARLTARGLRMFNEIAAWCLVYFPLHSGSVTVTWAQIHGLMRRGQRCGRFGWSQWVEMVARCSPKWDVLRPSHDTRLSSLVEQLVKTPACESAPVCVLITWKYDLHG